MRKMKDSGSQWIGCIPSYWDVGRIDNFYILRNTKVSDKDYPPLSVTMGGIVPQLDTAAKTNAHDDRKLVKRGDFVINSRSDRRGSCGISAYNGSVSLINTILAPKGEMDPEYYDWLFHTTQFSDEFYKWGHGIVDDLWTTNYQDMKKINIPVPPISEQNLIASYLKTQCAEIDALSADIQSEIDMLEAYKRSVITEVVTKGLDKNVPMKDSSIEWIGEIPQSADLIRLSYISSLRNGYVGPTKDIFVDDGVRYIQSLHIKSGRIKYDNNYYVNELWGQNHPKIHTGNLLFTQTGDIGQVALVEDDFDGCNCHALIICDVKQDKCNSKYLLYYFLGNAGLEELLRYETGTTLKHLNSTKIKNSLVVLHSMTEQMRIVAYLDNKCAEIEAIISRKQKQMDILADYKKSVIYEYVTGKKEVPVT